MNLGKIKYGYVYEIINNINGKIYIGATINIKQRFYTHKNKLKRGKHPNEHLQNSVNKYGLENFKFKPILKLPIEKLEFMEIFLIKSLNTINPKYGFNKQSGGKSNYKFSKEIHEKMSKKMTERVKTGNFHHPFINKKLSDTHKKNLSKARNTSGIMNVYKYKNKNCKQGFTWRYQYYDENGKRKGIKRINLDDLEKEVKARGLPWIKIEGE